MNCEEIIPHDRVDPYIVRTTEDSSPRGKVLLGHLRWTPAQTIALIFISFLIIVVGTRGSEHVPYNQSEDIKHHSSNRFLTTLTFSYTGSAQSYVVPSNVDFLEVDLDGAQGGGGDGNGNICSGGLGGSIQTKIPVTSGSTIYIYVGGKGGTASNVPGWNGGGAAGTAIGEGSGGGGTDIRVGGQAISNRVVVAGGGGGCYPGCDSGSVGGVGGNPATAGGAGCGTSGGQPGTTTAGGAAGARASFSGATAGASFQGGNGASAGAGGGGGYFGGGAGNGNGAGGGSSYTTTGTGTAYQNGAKSGNGACTITLIYDPTVTPTRAPTRKPTLTPTRTPTVVPTLTPTRQPTIVPTIVPTVLPTTTGPTVVPTVCPSIKPTAVPTVIPTATPTAVPTTVPTTRPTILPTIIPTIVPTVKPTMVPTVTPSLTPSVVPTITPTIIPSPSPSVVPTITPTVMPTIIPSIQPSVVPTLSPTKLPTLIPSVSPTIKPTQVPTILPSSQPSRTPSCQPSGQPTELPSSQPNSIPSFQPSASPSSQPTQQPLSHPSEQPSRTPSSQPSKQPQSRPSSQPSRQPTRQPNSRPSCQPAGQPSGQPIGQPTSQPSSQPSSSPNRQPTRQPSRQPSTQPTCQPSRQPASLPSSQPNSQPTSQPTQQPSVRPTLQPSVRPSAQPSRRPSSQPSISPSAQPSAQPSRPPSSQPTRQPSGRPSTQPSRSPSTQPSGQPSGQPSSQPLSKPSCQPSSQPTSQPAHPTAMPVMLTLGTLPHYHGISIVGDTQKVKIVLPFMQVLQVGGDGFNDVVVPAVRNASTSYVLFGNFSFPETVMLSTMPVDQGRLLVDVLSYDFSGRSVAIAGDINGDGFDDLIIGVPYVAKVYVLFGKPEGLTNCTEGFTIFGATEISLTGWSVSGAGDVNNDTFADIIVGAPNLDLQSGVVYVLYGRLNLFRDIHLDNLAPFQGFSVHGAVSGDYLGLSVSGAGDVNGDGFDDVVMGALTASKLNTGAVYVVFGSAVAARDYVRLNDSASGLFASYFGEQYAYVGYSVSSAGDVNQDGYDDIMIGSMPRKGAKVSELTYLLYGQRQWQPSTLLTSLSPLNGTVISGGGVVVSSVGDIDHDGFDDVMLGSGYGFSTGGGYVLRTPQYLPNVTSAPSVRPSPSPTILPTRVPTVAPTTRVPSIRPTVVPSLMPTAVPTNPTMAPTEAPSGPTKQPTLAPSQPSSVPSARPSLPTVAPTTLPSVAPTETPTREPEPTVEPTFAPSVAPTLGPSSVEPTMIPSTRPTEGPSKAPVLSFRPIARPSQMPVIAVPTVQPVVQYARVNISSPGVYLRTEVQTHYIINSTRTVEIDGLSTSAVVFTVLPNRESLLIVKRFSAFVDIIDLRAFKTVLSFPDLNITQLNTGYRRLSSVCGNESVVIYLEHRQRIILSHVTLSQLNETNFIFYTPQEAPPEAVVKEKKSFWPYVQISFISVVSAAIFFKLAQIAYEKFDPSKIPEMTPVEFNEIVRTNPTYLLLAHQDSLKSISSPSRSSSSSSKSKKKSTLDGEEKSKSDSDSSESVQTRSDDEDGDDKSQRKSRQKSIIRRMFGNNDRERRHSSDIDSIASPSFDSTVDGDSRKNSRKNSRKRSIKRRVMGSFDLGRGSPSIDTCNLSASSSRRSSRKTSPARRIASSFDFGRGRRWSVDSDLMPSPSFSSTESIELSAETSMANSAAAAEKAGVYASIDQLKDDQSVSSVSSHGANESRRRADTLTDLFGLPADDAHAQHEPVRMTSDCLLALDDSEMSQSYARSVFFSMDETDTDFNLSGIYALSDSDNDSGEYQHELPSVRQHMLSLKDSKGWWERRASHV